MTTASMFCRRMSRAGAAGLALAAAALALADGAAAAARRATPTSVFLDSIGVNTTFPDRGQPLDKTIEMIRYGGFRWVRAGYEGVTEKGPTTMQTFLDLHQATGVKLSWGLLSGKSDIAKLLETAKVLARAGALIAIEGNNEPNNWAVTYQGEKGGGRDGTWLPVAKLQRDLYQAVKRDPVLGRYPVWTLSEPGAQIDNVGLQFLTIPPRAKTLMPAGTRYGDFANVHNYIYHPRSPQPLDNKTWNTADPSAASLVDGLHMNYGVTWRRKFRGYSQAELDRLPRVTTETGTGIEGPITEELQGLNLTSLYLAQFKRGFAYTAVYILRDRVDEPGNQTMGFFKPDYTPRKAAHYLHNLTTILADRGRRAKPDRLDYAIAKQPETVHDLLLQRSDGTFQLVVWGERLSGSEAVTVRFAAPQARITVYNPIAGVEPVRTEARMRAVELTMSNHPWVLEISPRP
jgi:hypothetical protein